MPPLIISGMIRLFRMATHQPYIVGECGALWSPNNINLLYLHIAEVQSYIDYILFIYFYINIYFFIFVSIELEVLYLTVVTLYVVIVII